MGRWNNFVSEVGLTDGSKSIGNLNAETCTAVGQWTVANLHALQIDNLLKPDPFTASYNIDDDENEGNKKEFTQHNSLNDEKRAELDAIKGGNNTSTLIRGGPKFIAADMIKQFWNSVVSPPEVANLLPEANRETEQKRTHKKTTEE